MRILLIQQEFPYPPNNGLRIDMWRRLKAFFELEHDIFLIAWARPFGPEAPTEIEIDKVKAHCEDLVLLPMGGGLRAVAFRFYSLLRHPWYIAARILTSGRYKKLLCDVRRFDPQLIWVEAVHASALAFRLKSDLGVPLAYRSHNVEHKYLAEQASLTKSIAKRAALWLGWWRLERAELNALNRSDYIFDISMDDLKYWQGRGVKNATHLTSIADNDAAKFIKLQPDIDVLYLGNLSTPNNQFGILWFLENVWPVVISVEPNAKLVIAGKQPPEDLIVKIGTCDNVRLEANPESAATLYGRAKILINPIFHGSGVNIKSIDMIGVGIPVITTSLGVRGLSNKVRDLFIIADTSKEFSERVIYYLRVPRNSVDKAFRAAVLDREFGATAVEQALSTVRIN
jgi:hypothetical protein